MTKYKNQNPKIPNPTPKFFIISPLCTTMSKPLLSKPKQKEIALQRIKILFQQAELTFSKNKALANRYISLARTIAMKVHAKIPRELKRKVCKHCYKYLKPGVNARIRTRGGKVIISCLECKRFMRIPIRKRTVEKS